jgi:hypothetical protein
MESRCFTCQFWRQRDSEGYFGECHRHAPAPRTLTPHEDATARYKGDLSLAVIWPDICADDFCGDWKLIQPTIPPTGNGEGQR